MKKIMIKGLLGIALLAQFSCSEKEHFDVTGDNVNRIFVNTRSSYVNEVSFNVIHTPIGNMGDDVAIKIPVRATMPVSSSTRVTLALDPTLLDSYNAQQQTAYKAVPANLLEIGNGDLTIPSGATLSTDSISIKVRDIAALTESSYLIPLKITSISGAADADISGNLSTVFLRIHTRRTNVYDSPTSVPGTLITDRTGWTAQVAPAPTAGQVAWMFNTSTTQHWTLAPAAQCDIDVNMGSIKEGVQGIRMVSANNYRVTQVETFTSLDGVTWDSQGISTVSNSNNQFIRFYAPVRAHHTRIRVLDWQNANFIRVIQYHIYQ